VFAVVSSSKFTVAAPPSVTVAERDCFTKPTNRARTTCAPSAIPVIRKRPSASVNTPLPSEFNDTDLSADKILVDLSLVDPGRVVSIAGYRRRGDGIVLIGGGGDPGTEIRDAARPEVARLLASGELTLPIQATYPLEDTAEAHREGLTGHTRGKLVIVP